MKSVFLRSFFALLSISLTGCFQSYQKISTKPVIQVNEHMMTLKEFSGLLARKLKDLDSLTAKDPNFIERTKQQILKDFISMSLTLDYARSQNITLDEKSLDLEVDKIRASYPDDLTFRRELAAQNQSFSEWRELLRHTLIEKMVFQKITEKSKPPQEDELRKYYEQRKDFFKRKERIYIKQIVIADEARADYIKGELKKKSFDDLARKYSISPDAKENGLVGWIEKGSVDYFDPLFTKPTGQILGPIKSPFGYHLIRIEKKSAPTTLPYEEVRALLLKELLAKKEQAVYISWLDAQLRASRVLKNQELINSVRIETRSEN